MSGDLLYKNTGSLRIGDVHRFIITYTPTDICKEIGSLLYIKVKNIENVLMNSALLNGPYILYCDIRPIEYNHNIPCFITDDQPVYDPNINPGQSLIHKLTLNKLKDKYVWVVDIISQIIFSTTAEINFEFLIANDESKLHKNYSNLKNSNFNTNNLNIQHLTTLDIWNNPPRSISDPIHLVILTHGLHSNSSADMFYMKEQLEIMANKTNENIVIRAFFGNACKTERGVKYLGRRLAEFIINDSMVGLNDKVKKISFISHSLGGLVQTFAISYINFNYPDFFEKFQPENFITMASPLLGISNENPAYVKVFLKFGIVGKTGQDLNLEGSQPLLLLLPSERTRKILKKFKRRTVYANVLNDGIVPLRTSALLYLDWKGLIKVYETLSDKDHISFSENNINVNDNASEIPVDINAEISKNENHNEIDIVGSIKNKIQTTIGFCLPNMQAPKTTYKYNYFQTNDNLKTDGTADKLDKIMEPMVSLPKASVIGSIKKIILPPSPSSKYINDPKSRYDVILHDKIYTPDMIPKRHTTLSKNVIISQLEQNKRHRFYEEKIARRWHEGMTWRKVLVYLQPDAHNNMIVRRRFANAYGWQVVDHMVEEHFGQKCYKGEDLILWELKNSNNNESIDIDDSDIDEINMKFGQVMNQEFRKESRHYDQTRNISSKDLKNSKSPELGNFDRINIDTIGSENKSSVPAGVSQNSIDSNLKFNGPDSSEENSDSEDIQLDGNYDKWLNETGSGYYDGPTGLINSVNEGMAAWKNTVLNNNGDQDDHDLAILTSNDLKEMNEVGELNVYI